jgi:hypothetical protein
MYMKAVRGMLSQLEKTLCPSYCLCSLFNKIREKGKTASAWKGGDREGERKGGGGVGGRNDPNIVCTYE